VGLRRSHNHISAVTASHASNQGQRAMGMCNTGGCPGVPALDA
jgi:hypothetical protein